MSFGNVPSRSEVMHWNASKLSDYLKSDEDDYESPDAEDDVASGGDYESPNDDMPEQGESDNDYEPPPSDPPEDHQSKILPAKAICNNSDYIDNRNRASSVRTLPGQPPVPPQRPGATLPLPSSRGSMSSPLPPKCEERGYKPPKPGLPGAPSVDRTRKPTTMERSLPGLPERGSPKQGRKPPFGDKSLAQPRRPPSAEKPPDLHRMAKPPMPIDRNDSAMGRRQPASRPWAQDRRDEPQDDIQASKQQEAGLDPHWYVARITRPDAEDCLRNVNEDGAFLVRDSSKQSAVQPFVLMVLYRNKVFNIQIRYQEEQNVYLLGTGFKGKDNFSSVSEIIDYHMQTPLLLIDGKNRSSGQKSQCRLSYPAGYE
ncbi:UNVERIFIED_CONTAM: hypothetical protein FKN15_017081 [Acipenser sinensis]